MLRILTAVAALSAVALAQRPPSWVELSVPGGVTPGAVTQIGKVAYLPTGGDLQVFSAAQRTWTSWPLSGGETITAANDLVLVRDGGSFAAFGASRGTFEVAALSSSAQLVNPPSQRNDSLILVLDGDELWAFSAFTGRWLMRPLGANASIAVQRHVAVVADDSTLAGLSAYGSRWIEQSIPASAGVRAISADGTAGVVELTSEVWGFSAQRQTWTSAPLPAGATFGRGADAAVWSDGTTLLGFSGLRGAFDSASGNGVVQAEQQLVAVVNASTVQVFSAATARWTTLSLPPAAQLRLGAATALVVESFGATGYSALNDGEAQLPSPVLRSQVGWSTAAVVDGNTGSAWFYSAITNTWVEAASAPVDPLHGLTLNGGWVRTGSGVAAFDARRAALVEIAVPASSAIHTDPATSILAVETKDSLHCFDFRRGAWVSAPIRAPLSTVLWRTSLVASEPGRLLGFGSQSGEIGTFDVTGNVTDLSASSESGRALLNDAVVAFSATPDLSFETQFPEFRRMAVRGAPVFVGLHAEPGAFAVMVAGLPWQSRFSLPGGELFLDPTAPLIALPVQGLDNDGRLRVRLGTPGGPALSGVTVGLQAIVAAPSGAPYLSHLGTVTLF